MGFGDMVRNLPPVTKNLLIVNIIIWLAMALVPSLSHLLEAYGALYYFTSDQFLPSQLITYMFIHANFTHLFFNMWALFMFGVMMERVLGSQKFLFYYVSCGLGAALVQEGAFALMINHYSGLFADSGAVRSLLSHSTVTNGQLMALGISPIEPAIHSLFGLYHTPTIGASGAIFGILLAYGYMFPNMRIYMIIPPMPIKARTFVIIYAVIELALGVYNSQADTVAHFAHLGGMLAGLLLLIYWRKKHIIGGPYNF